MKNKLPIIKYFLPVLFLLISTNAFALTSGDITVIINSNGFIQLDKINSTGLYYISYYNSTGEILTINSIGNYIGPNPESGTYELIVAPNNSCNSINKTACELLTTFDTFLYDSDGENLTNLRLGTTYVAPATPTVSNTSIFSNLSATDTGQVATVLGANIRGGVSNLWPIIIIITGMIITFYVLTKIIALFPKNDKIKSRK